MKKAARSTHKEDKHYDKVRVAVDGLLQDRFVVIPVEAFIQMGILTKGDYEGIEQLPQLKTPRRQYPQRPGNI